MKKTTKKNRGIYLAIFIVVVEAFLWALALYQNWQPLYRATLMISVFLVAVSGYVYWHTMGWMANLAVSMGCIVTLIACGLLMIHDASSEWMIGIAVSGAAAYMMSMIIVAIGDPE